MKKVLTLVLALTMALSLVACGGEGGGSKGDKKLKILETEYALEDYAICISKDNQELLDKVNGALAALAADGTTKKIVDKYISGVEHDLTFQTDAEGKPELMPPSPPMSTMRTTRSWVLTRRWPPPLPTSWG